MDKKRKIGVDDKSREGGRQGWWMLNK